MNNMPAAEERVIVSSRYRENIHPVLAGIILIVGHYYIFQLMSGGESIAQIHQDGRLDYFLLFFLYGLFSIFVLFNVLLYRFHFFSTVMVLTKNIIILPSKDFFFGFRRIVPIVSVVKIIARGDLLAEKRINFLNIIATGKGGSNVSLGSERYCLQGGVVIVFGNGENIRLDEDYYSCTDIDNFVQALLDRRPDIEVVER